MKKLIKTIVFIIIVFFVLQKFFLYTDLKNDCLIYIKPSLFEFSNLNIKRAMKALKYSVPEDYVRVCKNVKVINPSVGCGGFGGGCFYAGEYSNPNEIFVSTSLTSLLYTMNVIVHETCHSIQFKEGRDMNEDECYTQGDSIIDKVVAY